jgi:hypothetical protein
MLDAQRAEKKDARAATIEGDHYIVYLSGDVARGIGRTVYLLRDDEILASARLRFCQYLIDREKELRDSLRRVAAPLEDSIRAAEPEVQAALNARRRDTLSYDILDLYSRARTQFRQGEAIQSAFRRSLDDSVEVLFSTLAVARAPTGMHAHFRFERVLPGAYVLATSWYVHERTRRWWVPVQVRAAEIIKRDLDTEGTTERWLNCR